MAHFLFNSTKIYCCDNKNKILRTTNSRRRGFVRQMNFHLLFDNDFCAEKTNCFCIYHVFDDESKSKAVFLSAVLLLSTRQIAFATFFEDDDGEINGRCAIKSNKFTFISNIFVRCSSSFSGFDWKETENRTHTMIEIYRKMLRSFGFFLYNFSRSFWIYRLRFVHISLHFISEKEDEIFIHLSCQCKAEIFMWFNFVWVHWMWNHTIKVLMKNETYAHGEDNNEQRNASLKWIMFLPRFVKDTQIEFPGDIHCDQY